MADTAPPEPMLQFFEYRHLPPQLQEISRACAKLALGAVAALPRNAERTAGLRKLLEAKDCFVRARLFNADSAGPPAVDSQDVTHQVLQTLARIEERLQGNAAADAAHEAHMATALQQLSDQVDTLMGKVQAQGTVQQSGIVLMQGLATMLRNAHSDVGTLDQLRQKVAAASEALDQGAQAMATAIAANTVAEEQPPAQQPGGGTSPDPNAGGQV